MKVQKFGGTSVANADNILKCVDIFKESSRQKPTIVVVSALSGVTDLLLNTIKSAENSEDGYKEYLQMVWKKHTELINAFFQKPHKQKAEAILNDAIKEIEEVCKGAYLLGEASLRIKDKIAGYGEYLSSKLIYEYIKTQNIDVIYANSIELIKTNENSQNAIVDFELTNKNIKEFIQNNSSNLYIAPGFISSSVVTNSITTLGRGGSDYTAAIYAAAIDADELEIWTDVSGVMTADPRLVPSAKSIPAISYKEAMELSHFGAKVIYPPTIQPVMKKNIPVWIKNTFDAQHLGTLITNQSSDNKFKICGITSINKIALISVEGAGMIGIPGISKQVFETLAINKINVILITQSSSEHSICIAIQEADIEKAKQVLDESFNYKIGLGQIEPTLTEANLSIIAVVGDGMKNHAGVSGKMMSNLGKNGINIRAIAQGSSERNISVVIATKDIQKALNVLHEEFFEIGLKQVNLFIAGAGNVGKRLLAQLNQQKKFLNEKLQININVVGLTNSRKMIFNAQGIDLVNWKESLEQSKQAANIDTFIETAVEQNLRNSVFVDVTANDVVATKYLPLLKKSIAVVACNKIAAASDFKYYKLLKDTALEFNTHFLFETNVGAGLPIINTLNDLVKTGDTIHKMQAVLSGTLNFVFNNYNGEKSFSDVVAQAQAEGYTEPDPRLDLGGKDVMRKILILSREIGKEMEMDEIKNNSFLPEKCMQGSVEDFYKSMKEEEAHFLELYKKAKAEDCILKFVATYENGKASVGLQHIPPSHDLYHLYGKDNIVLFYTDRYPDQPLVIKGAGAGADVTASGVFADILRAINH